MEATHASVWTKWRQSVLWLSVTVSCLCVVCQQVMDGYILMKHSCYNSTPACREPDAAFLAERPRIILSEEDMYKNMTAPLFNDSHIEFQHGTRLPYRCQSGYQYDDSVTNIPSLVCMNGVWSGGHKCTGSVFGFVACNLQLYYTVLIYTAKDV